MKHPLSKSTAVTIEGKTYELVMTHGVYIEAEEITGISTITDGDKYFSRPSRRTLSALFYALLKNAGARFTLDEVQTMITAKNLKSIFQTILLANALAEAEADESGPTVTTAAETE